MDPPQDSPSGSKKAATNLLNLLDWQLLLLPFMLLMVGGLTFFSAFTSISQFNRLHNRLETSPSIELSTIGFQEINVSDLSEDAKL